MAMRGSAAAGAPPIFMVKYKTMKTTIELPDDLFVSAKKAAAERRTTLRALIELGLRKELAVVASPAPRSRRIKWVTVNGGLPAGVDVANRERLVDWMGRGR